MRVFRRGKKWWIDFMLEGRRYREPVGTNKALAESVLHKRMTEIAEGKFFPKKRKESKMRFEDFTQEFMRLHSEVNKRPSSTRRDLSLIKNLSTYFKGKRISDITPAMVEEYKSIRLKAVKPATVNREVSLLKTLLTKAVEWNKISDNPIKSVELLKEDNTRLRFLTKEEIRRLIDTCSSHLRPVVITALYTGMRKSEILGLQWQDINFATGLITLLRTKNNEKRDIPMSETIKETLKELRLSSFNKNSPYVFCKPDGQPYLNVRKSFATALKQA